MIIKTDLFEDFCDKVINALSDYYKEDCEIRIQNVRKTNGIMLKGLTISRKNQNIIPTVYLDNYYEAFVHGKSFTDIISNIISIYEDNSVINDFDFNFFQDYERVKNKICYKLINYEMNRELLDDVPYLKFLDLAIVCHCIIINDFMGSGSVLIHRNHVSEWGIEDERLFQDAKNNMSRMFPVEMKNITDIIRDMFISDKNDALYKTNIESHNDIAQCFSNQLEEMKKSSIQMYVLTNKSKMNGASCILYENVMEEIALLFEKDIYILPSSIHEVILIPQNDDVDEVCLSRMVNEVNQTQLKTEEILSNHAYLYKKDLKQILSLPLIPE